MIRINEIALSLDEDESQLKKKAAKILKINEKYIKKYTIYKKSIDARKKDDVHFTYSLDVNISLDEEQIASKCKSNKVQIVKPYVYELPENKRVSKFRPVVVGFGPAGMFAGLILALSGLKPIILERGKDVEARKADVQKFWREKKLNEESNVQFGEGGAGTFSDGKLTTGIKSPFIKKILEELSDVETMEIAIIENLQREDLNPIEEAEGLQALIDRCGFTQEEVATSVGKSRPAIANALRLLKLPQEVRDMTKNGEISAGHARALLSFDNEAMIYEVAQNIVKNNLTVRDVERLAKTSEKTSPSAKRKSKRRDSFYDEVELTLTEVLGRKVKVYNGRGKGTLEIEFYSADDLKEIANKLGE